MRLGGVAVRALIAFLVCAVLLGLSATSASAAEVGYGEHSFGYDGRAFDYDRQVWPEDASAGSAQGSERSFGAQPFGVGASSNEELRGCDRGDAWTLKRVP